jgi:hypothetical protein
MWPQVGLSSNWSRLRHFEEAGKAHAHTQVVCFRRTEISCYAYSRWEKF